MPTIWVYTIASVSAVSLISFVGLAALTFDERRLRRIVFVSVSLAAGAMFGNAFIHLIPEAFERGRGAHSAPLYILTGVFTFFVLEKLLRRRHTHDIAGTGSPRPFGYLNLIADGVHNFMDGLLVGASFLAGPQVGLTTTAAVILHEIPQEIGDFGVLLHAGFGRTRALLFNFLTAWLALLGAAVALLVGGTAERFTAATLPFTAGGFIYIAGSDLLPELQEEVGLRKSLVQLAAMCAGVGLMLLPTLFD